MSVEIQRCELLRNLVMGVFVMGAFVLRRIGKRWCVCVR